MLGRGQRQCHSFLMPLNAYLKTDCNEGAKAKTHEQHFHKTKWQSVSTNPQTQVAKYKPGANTNGRGSSGAVSGALGDRRTWTAGRDCAGRPAAHSQHSPAAWGLHNRSLFFHSFGGWEPKVKVSADLVSPAASPWLAGGCLPLGLPLLRPRLGPHLLL